MLVLGRVSVCDRKSDADAADAVAAEVRRLPTAEAANAELEKRAHVQHADGRAGDKNFFGVNAFCTKTWFFGCQRCSVDVAASRRGRSRRQR